MTRRWIPLLFSTCRTNQPHGLVGLLLPDVFHVRGLIVNSGVQSRTDFCYRWSFFWPSESQRKRNMLWQQGWSLTLCRRTFPWPRSLDPWQDLHKSCLLFYLTCRHRRVESSRVESCILTQSSVDSMFSPGNMMHVPSVGLVTLAALCSCRFK